MIAVYLFLFTLFIISLSLVVFTEQWYKIVIEMGKDNLVRAKKLFGGGFNNKKMKYFYPPIVFKIIFKAIGLIGLLAVSYIFFNTLSKI